MKVSSSSKRQPSEIHDTGQQVTKPIFTSHFTLFIKKLLFPPSLFDYYDQLEPGAVECAHATVVVLWDRKEALKAL